MGLRGANADHQIRSLGRALKSLAFVPVRGRSSAGQLAEFFPQPVGVETGGLIDFLRAARALEGVHAEAALGVVGRQQEEC